MHEYRIEDFESGDTLAVLRIELGDEPRVMVQWAGEGEWEEDDEALGLMLGEHGRVVPV